MTKKPRDFIEMIEQYRNGKLIIIPIEDWNSWKHNLKYVTMDEEE